MRQPQKISVAKTLYHQDSCLTDLHQNQAEVVICDFHAELRQSN